MLWKMLLIFMAFPQVARAVPRYDWQATLHIAADYHNLSVEFLDALITVESNWDPRAVSPAGAKGLAQLMPITVVHLAIDDPFDPHQAIWGAAIYLRQLHNRFRDWRLALAAYNAGPTAVRACNCSPYSETRQYVQKIEDELANKNLVLD